MIGRIEQSLRFQSEALQLRAQRQQVLSANIANADTPGYKAVDIDFARALRDSLGGSTRVAQRTSAPGHLVARFASSATPAPTESDSVQPAQDGNSVDMDKERARIADNAVRYEATLKFINGQIRTLLSAIQGQ
jgi:flagellar basal-body rod protein FlgB